MKNTGAAQETSLSKEKLYVLILAAIQIAHVLDFVIMMPLGPQFMRVFNLTPNEFSTLVSVYTFSAGFFGLFGALYADQFDRKKFLLFNFTGFIAGTFLCAIAPNYEALLTGRIVAGAFGGILNACVIALVSDLIPFERRGRAMGVVMSAFSISSVIGIPIGLYIANLFDWHATFYFICIVGLVFWLLAFIYLPSVKASHFSKNFKGQLLNFKNIITQKDYILCFIFTSVLAFGIFAIVPFISPYMVKNVGLREDQLPLIYLFGGSFTIIAAQIIGKMCDKVGSIKVFRFLAISSIFPILLLTNLPPSPIYLSLAATTLFMMFGSGRFIPAMTMLSAIVKQQDRGTFMSLENSSRQFSAGAGSHFAGLIMGISATGTLTHYNHVGIFSVISVLIALYITRLLKRKFHLR